MRSTTYHSTNAALHASHSSSSWWTRPRRSSYSRRAAPAASASAVWRAYSSSITRSSSAAVSAVAPISDRPAQVIAEPREQVARVVLAGARLGVVPPAEHGPPLDGDALVAAIEQVLVRDVHARRQGRRIDHEAVVLRRDLDLAGGPIEHRVVPAVVAERQLPGARAEREP